jgi:hypothetical protein
MMARASGEAEAETGDSADVGTGRQRDTGATTEAMLGCGHGTLRKW